MSKEEQNHPASEFGTDRQFLHWVSYQPSILDGEFQQDDDGEGNPRNTACHVRRLKRGAGMGIKPPFSAVPMTDDQHRMQSAKDGEVWALRKYKNLDLTPEQAAEWFERAANRILQKWIEFRKQLRRK